MITESGAACAVIEAMEKYPSDSCVCEQGCKALSTITPIKFKTMEEAEGAVKLILKVIREHKANHAVCKHGCNSLSGIMEEKSEQKVNINISDVIAATKDYIYDAGLYMTLCDIFCNAQTTKEKERDGIFHLLLEGIHIHMGNEKLCAKGNSTLNYFTKICIKEDDKAEFIEAAIKSMHIHKMNIEVCNQALLLLSNVQHDFGDIMANSKVIVEILEVLRLHKKDEDICKSGFDAIANQTKSSETYRSLAGRFGVANVLREALEEHEINTELCKKGFSAIYSIIDGNEENTKSAGKAGLIEEILKIIRIHTKEEGDLYVS